MNNVFVATISIVCGFPHSPQPPRPAGRGGAQQPYVAGDDSLPCVALRSRHCRFIARVQHFRVLHVNHKFHSTDFLMVSFSYENFGFRWRDHCGLNPPMRQPEWPLEAGDMRLKTQRVSGLSVLNPKPSTSTGRFFSIPSRWLKFDVIRGSIYETFCILFINIFM